MGSNHFPLHPLHHWALRTASLFPFRIQRGKGLFSMLNKNTHMYIKKGSTYKNTGAFPCLKKQK